jgi:hypothetical protein
MRLQQVEACNLQNAFHYLDLLFTEFKLESYLFKLPMNTAHKLKIYCPRETAAHLVTADEVISFL